MAETLEMGVETLNGPDNNERESKIDLPKATVSSDSSSSDSDSDEDNSDLKLGTLEKEIAENPSSYDIHVQYIRVLRKMGDIEKLRKARESMSALFPLSPKMWQEWAKDEASLSDGSEAFDAIVELYERGVKEYLSVPLWCDYINFVQEHDREVSQCTPAGILKMRDLFERALTAAGLHVIEGSKIWEAYREFEQAIFFTIDDADSGDKTKQVQRIRSLFHRQLSVPLTNSRSTLLAYKLWEVERGSTIDVNSDDCDGLPSHTKSAYQKAMQTFNDRVQYEDQLSQCDSSETERLKHFMTYIKFEESYGDPARVQILYERAITKFPVSSDLWLSYTRYLDKTLKVSNVARSVYSRATRSCTWVAELWIRYLLSLERAHASEKEFSAVFEHSLQCGFSNYEEYLDLFLTRIDGLRRRISLPSELEDGLNYALIRDTFQYASEYLSSYLKNTDGLLRLHSYWARLELNLGKDLVAARGVWESLIKTSGAMLEVWQGYIAMEIELGHINEARSIYKRCYSKRFSGTGSEDLCHSWLRFEREFGTLEEFDQAERKVVPRLEELQLYRSQQESKSVAASATPKEDPPAKNSSQKRKLGTRVTELQSQSKRQKNTAQKTIELGKTTGENDADHKSNEAIDAEPNEASNVSTFPDTVKPDTTNEQIGDHLSEGGKPLVYTDQCTAFVSSLSLQANEEHLREFFSDSGGVTAIRLLKEKFSGKSRGLAYVDFSDDAHLEAAVAKNKQKLLGQKLSIARSDPKKSQKRGSFGSSNARGRGRGMPSGSERGVAMVSKESLGVSKESATGNAPPSVSHRRGGHVQLLGKNTFAMPRNVARSLGGSSNDQTNEANDDKPKSNDEFRKMLFKN
ncbi:hypothetical protein AAC387_Pa01g0384 [Persea americana]